MTARVLCQPPAVGGETYADDDQDAIRAARYRSERHPMAVLVTLRKQAADEVDRLLAFLDATEGDIELGDHSEPTLEEVREAGRCWVIETEDDEEGEASGIADMDGLIEQYGHYFDNTKIRETAGEAAPHGSY